MPNNENTLNYANQRQSKISKQKRKIRSNLVIK